MNNTTIPPHKLQPQTVQPDTLYCRTNMRHNIPRWRRYRTPSEYIYISTMPMPRIIEALYRVNREHALYVMRDEVVTGSTPPGFAGSVGRNGVVSVYDTLTIQTMPFLRPYDVIVSMVSDDTRLDAAGHKMSGLASPWRVVWQATSVITLPHNQQEAIAA